jgi:hypothetical protein
MLHLNLWKKRLGSVPVWEQTELETLVLADNGLSDVSEQDWPSEKSALAGSGA